MSGEVGTLCRDCGLDPSDPCFVDVILPDAIWERIAPVKGSILCFACIVRRLRLIGETEVPYWIINGPLRQDQIASIPFEYVGPDAYGWTMQKVMGLSDQEREKLKKRMGIVAALRRARFRHPRLSHSDQCREAGLECGVSVSTVNRLWQAA